MGLSPSSLYNTQQQNGSIYSYMLLLMRTSSNELISWNIAQVQKPAVYQLLKKLSVHLMCIGPCIVVIGEEEEPTGCYLVFYYTYDRLNMFRTPLCPSSGAHDRLHQTSNHQQPKNQTAHMVISGMVVIS
jgi:hypothetical protein